MSSATLLFALFVVAGLLLIGSVALPVGKVTVGHEVRGPSGELLYFNEYVAGYIYEGAVQ